MVSPFNASVGSFYFDAGRLEDWPPFLDFGLLKGTEHLGRLLVARENFLADIGEPSTPSQRPRGAKFCASSIT
jgi:hypothetical protein